jgi:hypothetical protein
MTFTGLHGVTFQNTELFIVTSVRTPGLTNGLIVHYAAFLDHALMCYVTTN